MFAWLPVAYRRLFLVLAILIVLAIPTAYLVMRSQTKTAADFVEEAERHRAAGNLEQARLSTDKALEQAETVDARVEILKSLAAARAAEKPETPEAAFKALLESATTQMRILQEDSANAPAADAVAAFHLAAFRQLGASIANHDVVAHQMQRVLSARPAHGDAAEVLIRSQLGSWRGAAAKGELTVAVVRERLKPLRFVLQERSTLAIDVFYFLQGMAGSRAAEAESFRELGREVLSEIADEAFSGSKLAEIMKGLGDAEPVSWAQVADAAIAEASQLQSPDVAQAWLGLLARDQQLVWDGSNLLHRGYQRALRFIEALPAEISVAPSLMAQRRGVLWHLGDGGLESEIDEVIALAASTSSPSESSLRIWGEGTAAASLKAELIMERNAPAATRVEALRELGQTIEGVFGAEMVSAKLTIYEQILDGWYYTALPELLARSDADPYAAVWGAFVLDLIGAPDEAYRRRAQLAGRIGGRLPARYHWRNLVGMLRLELARKQQGLARAALNKMKVEGENTPLAEAREAAALLDLLGNARYGDAGKVRAKLAELPPSDGKALAQACRASVLLELGEDEAALSLLNVVELGEGVVNVWPGIESGHLDAWRLLEERVRQRAAAAGDGGLSARVFEVFSDRGIFDRETLRLTLVLSSGRNAEQVLFRLARGLAAGNRFEELGNVLALWDSLPEQGAMRKAFELQSSLSRNQVDRARELLAELEADGVLAPVQAEMAQAQIALIADKRVKAAAMVDSLLKRCPYHLGAWRMAAAMARTEGGDEDLADAEKAYLEILRLNAQSAQARGGLYQVYIAQGRKREATGLLAQMALRQGRLGDLASLEPEEGKPFDSKPVIEALLKVRREAQLTTMLELQLISLMWRSGRKGEARELAEAALPRLRKRLPQLMSALAVLGDQAAAEELGGYLKMRGEEVSGSELLAIGRFWELRGHHDKAETVLKQCKGEAGKKYYAAWLLRRGRVDDATQLLLPMWQERRAPESGMLLADAYLAQGKADQALAIVDQLEGIGKITNRLALARARIIGERDPKEGAALAKAFIEANPMDAWGYLVRAKIRFRDPEAVSGVGKDLERAVELSPSLEEARTLLADWRLRHGDAVGAVALLQAGREQAPGSMRVAAAEVLSLLQNLEVEKAADAAADLVVRFPRVAVAQRLAIHAFVTCGRYGQALPLAQQFVLDQPESVVDLNNAAHLLAVTGTDYEKALRHINKAIAVAGPKSPYRSYLFDTRALVLTCAGDYGEVIAGVSLHAADHRPAHKLYLATACAARGRTADAKKLVSSVQAGEQSQQIDWYAGLADLGAAAPKSAAAILLPVLRLASQRAELDTGNPEVAAKLFAALARLQHLAGESRAQVLVNLRASSGLSPNPWAAVLRAQLEVEQGADATAAIAVAREQLATRPVPVLARRLESALNRK